MSNHWCTLCARMFGGCSAFDKHLRWANEQKQPDPDGHYRVCVDPAELGMVEKNGVWVTKHRFKNALEPVSEG